MKWAKNLDLPKLLNDGVQTYRKKVHLVYISQDINEEPDFTLCIFDSIQKGKPALYAASITRCFGNFSHLIFTFDLDFYRRKQ